MLTLKASKTPVQDIERAAYAGQDPKRRQFREGYQSYMAEMPIIDLKSPLYPAQLTLSQYWMEMLGKELSVEPWIKDKQMEPGTFERTIIGIEETDGTREGAEIVVAQWGLGFSSPVHGHAVGYMHEAILSGKVRVNTYRMISPESSVVRPVRTDIITQGTFASVYNAPNPANVFPRQALIHNFTALETTSTLHFLPEHTRDGRDNKFTVEYFEDVHHLSLIDVIPITSQEGMYLQKGDVALVRSSNVPEYGDHYIVITGHPIMKEHGLRPQDVAIQAPHATVLDFFGHNMGLTLLKLKPEIAKRFHEFHGITMQDGEVIFPTA